jgi:3-oxoacyl-[acyl-carrier protein] reductase
MEIMEKNSQSTSSKKVTEARQKKRAIITGSASGIGRATALRFAREGWDLCLVDRDEDRLAAVTGILPPGGHLTYAGSYDSHETADRTFETIKAAWGSVDVLVNCAGIFMTGDILESPLEEWRRPFDMMVDGAVLMSRMAAGLMPPGGRIVHVTSIHGERVERGASAYGMAKAAINQYVRALAIELAPRNILVNAIAPGFVDTPMSIVNGINELEGEWFQNHYVKGHHLPLRRAGQPEEIAGVIFFLAGPDSTYITGQVIHVDGGLTITF